MTRAKALVAGIVVAGIAIASALGAGTTPSVTLTSPKAGSTYSAKKNPTITVAGKAAFAPVDPASSKFYLRRDGCGTSSDNPHLSVATPSGTDGGEGCGFVGGNGIASEVAPGLFSVDFPSTDGMPVILDTSKTIDGTLDLQNDTAGVGQVTLDFTLEALVGGEGIVVGSDTETVLVDPTTSDYPTEFHITPNPDLEQALVSGLDLHVFLHGAYSDSGYIGVSGKSWLTVGGYTASPNRSVEISLDDAGFSNPVSAPLDSSATSFSTTIRTPAVGKHVVYARATQGFDTSAVASSAFTVKR